MADLNVMEAEALQYILRALDNTDQCYRLLDEDELERWARAHPADIGLKGAAWRQAVQAARKEVEADGEADEDALARKLIAVLQAAIARRLARAGALQPSPQWAVLDEVSAAHGHVPDERLALGMAFLCSRTPFFAQFFDTFSGYGLHQHAEFLAILSGSPAVAFVEALDEEGPLLAQGLVEHHPVNGIRLAPGFMVTLARASRRGLGYQEALLGRSAVSELAPADMAWLDDHVTLMREILAQAVAKREAGINILLHGRPGMGKTELAKMLGGVIGAQVFLVGEPDGSSKQLVRPIDRLYALQSAGTLLARRAQPSVLLFDEAEDMFESDWGGADAPTKLQVNRLLENNPVPTIWTSNSIELTDPAHLRRFSYVLELKAPPVSVRRERVRDQMAHHGLEVSDSLLNRMASNATLAPGLIQMAARVTRLVDGREAQFAQAVGQMLLATGGALADESVPVAGFDPALSKADIDIGELTTRLVAAGKAPYSLLLYGVPGTGKTAYTRELAAQLGMPVLVKRASDLLGAYLGETEKAISSAFAEAAGSGAFLVIDEADSLLMQRANARQQWEVSQVNEMLIAMERHPRPFAFTTNLVSSLDPAALRRFTFKVRFDYMTSAQAVLAFERYFGIGAPEPIRALARLAPGDFSVVKRKADLLAIADPAELLRMLQEEEALKPAADAQESRGMGFLAKM